MPVRIDLDRAIFRWQARHNERMTYTELAERAGITIQALNRLKSGEVIAPDLRKINEICKVLECEPGDLIVRIATAETDEAAKLEAERQKILHDLEAQVGRKLRVQQPNQKKSITTNHFVYYCVVSGYCWCVGCGKYLSSEELACHLPIQASRLYAGYSPILFSN